MAAYPDKAEQALQSGFSYYLLKRNVFLSRLKS
jgi:hypothetical protein